jgi:hypothetical protein
MKKTLVSLLCLSAISFGGLAVHAEGTDTITEGSNSTASLDDYSGIDMGQFTDLESYTENENANDGLNAREGYKPFNIDLSKKPKNVNIPEFDPSLDPLTFTTYGAGTWDWVASDWIQTEASKIVHSGGGDFQITIDQPYIGPGFEWIYRVYEDDGAVGDDYIGQWEMGNYDDRQGFQFSTAGLLDGGNGAEIYIRKLTVATHSVYVQFYD